MLPSCVGSVSLAAVGVILLGVASPESIRNPYCKLNIKFLCI